MASTEQLSDDLTAADPYPAFARLRERAPVHFNEQQRAWVISRYDDVASGFRDPRLSSDRITPFLNALPPERRGSAAPVLVPLSRWMVFEDPPAHARLRSLVAPAFTSAALSRLATRSETIVDDLLDAFIAEGHEDLLQHVASPLPAIVIAELLGVPPSAREDFKAWSDELALVVFGAVDVADRYARAVAGLESLNGLFTDLIAARTSASHDDLISVMVHEGERRDDPLTPEELTAMCVLLLFAGHETTANLIGAGVAVLLHHPEQLALLRDRPELIGSAVEELLRFEGPAKLSIRQATTDLELRGRTIEAGQRVLLLHAAANRDPARFPDPERLDITRQPNPHLGFGHGIHTCVGAALARLEARIAIPRILERLPGLACAEETLAWQPTILGRSLRRLPVLHAAS